MNASSSLCEPRGTYASWPPSTAGAGAEAEAPELCLSFDPPRVAA